MGQDAITALAVCTKEIDETKGTHYHQRFLDFMRDYQQNDVAGCCAQNGSKGDRLKKPADQENPDHYLRVVERRRTGLS
jgi:aromatic ring hydroxylase